MKYILMSIGIIATGLGAIGVVLPVLPTTPFLLLAAFCFAKSSKRFHQWLVNTSMYKNHMESFVESRSMTVKSKIYILTLASTMLLLAAYFMKSVHLRIFILCLIVFKYYYFLFKIKTIRKEGM